MDAHTAQAIEPMDTSRPITLLHVSDPQFGRNHRFGNLALRHHQMIRLILYWHGLGTICSAWKASTGYDRILSCSAGTRRSGD